jgi:sugar/nucleoside kinase (ribokinase family)
MSVAAAAGPRVRVAGNTVIDMLARNVVEPSGPAADAWGANVQVLDDPIAMVLGGCGAAPAYVLGHLGVEVALDTNLGDDAAGQVAAGWLRQAGVRLSAARARATAVHLIMLTPAGQRRSAYFPGERVDWAQALLGATPAWFLISGYGRVDATDLEQMTSVCARMQQRGARVAFDPSPWFAGRVSAGAMRKLWAHVDCLVGTADELSHWCPVADPAKLAPSLLALGPSQVVLKQGAAGATWAAVGEAIGHGSTDAVDAANTVGAGDSFNGRLLAGLCRGETLAQATQAAVTLATRVVRRGRGVLGAFN